MSRALPTYLGGGYFGPKENVVCQSAATAAGSLGLVFTSGVPAAYQLGLLGNSPKEDFGRLCTFMLACAYYGMFFAIPLRKLYILKQKLVSDLLLSYIGLSELTVEPHRPFHPLLQPPSPSAVCTLERTPKPTHAKRRELSSSHSASPSPGDASVNMRQASCGTGTGAGLSTVSAGSRLSKSRTGRGSSSSRPLSSVWAS